MRACVRACVRCGAVRCGAVRCGACVRACVCVMDCHDVIMYFVRLILFSDR